ncbi:F-actin-capping protein subunit beta [Phyllobates terribilis]|uniref:F-actin-capping protein subunit beta n=1 Tax=Phyllobates terribilis TaxID=111132 RepID=UPI003CCB5A0B
MYGRRVQDMERLLRPPVMLQTAVESCFSAAHDPALHAAESMMSCGRSIEVGSGSSVRDKHNFTTAAMFTADRRRHYYYQVPSLCEDLLSSVDQPLKIARDKVVGKDYLLCDYNRDGDSYRSPWSNKYDPPLEDGAMPSARLRKLEVEANNAFDQYRDLYFEGGVSSVYLWDLDHGFAGVILIKKAGDGSKKIKGCWDSIHVVEVQEKSSGRTAHYKLTSTVMLWLQTNKSGSGTMNLGGSLTRQMEKDETVSDCSPHIANIGRLVEDMENKIRSTLNEIYFGKTKDIVNGLRSVQTFADKSKQEALKNDLVEALKRKQQS